MRAAQHGGGDARREGSTAPNLDPVVEDGNRHVAARKPRAPRSKSSRPTPRRFGEAAPTKKATLERSFATVKRALVGIATLTGRIAAAVPDLKGSPELAKACGGNLLATFLRVYGAARAPAGERPGDPGLLAAAAARRRWLRLTSHRAW